MESVESMIQSLRVGFLALGAALVFLSACFGLYVHKQNKMLTSQIKVETRLLDQTVPVYTNDKRQIEALLQDMQGYYPTHQDIIPILMNHNFAKVQLRAVTSSSRSPSTPPSPGKPAVQ